MLIIKTFSPPTHGSVQFFYETTKNTYVISKIGHNKLCITLSVEQHPKM